MDDEKTILLEEYKQCQTSANRLEDTIWKTFSAIGIIAVAPLTVFTYKGNVELNMPMVIISGILVIAATWAWWGMAGRWWDIQHITFMRMQHIEEDLKYLYQIRYVKYKDGQLDVEDSDLDLERKEKLQKDPEIKKKGVQKSLRWFPGLVTIVWIIAIITVIFINIVGRR